MVRATLEHLELLELSIPVCEKYGSLTNELGSKGSPIGDLDALIASARVGYRPEIALVRLRLAELLLDGPQPEHVEARAYLDLAVPELEAMGMAPFVLRARSLQARALA